jgi:hypothetical protein
MPVSIKVRVTSGCFHREHSPAAYLLIDEHLAGVPASDGRFAFEEHESGPEILVFTALATAGVTLAKSVIDLVVAIIKARSEGRRKGDHPDAPLELIVRRSVSETKVEEELILRVSHDTPVQRSYIETALQDGLKRLLGRDETRIG